MAWSRFAVERLRLSPVAMTQMMEQKGEVKVMVYIELPELPSAVYQDTSIYIRRNAHNPEGPVEEPFASAHTKVQSYYQPASTPLADGEWSVIFAWIARR